MQLINLEKSWPHIVNGSKMFKFMKVLETRILYIDPFLKKGNYYLVYDEQLSDGDSRYGTLFVLDGEGDFIELHRKRFE